MVACHTRRHSWWPHEFDHRAEVCEARHDARDNVRSHDPAETAGQERREGNGVADDVIIPVLTEFFA
jgi:hypothetical protein